MSEDKKYNGWTNYETWLVNLWMGNDEGSYRYHQELAIEVWNDATPGEDSWQTRVQQATYTLSKQLENLYGEQVEEALPEAGLLTDLLNAALNEVNWFEIAEHAVADVDKTEEVEVEVEEIDA